MIPILKHPTNPVKDRLGTEIKCSDVVLYYVKGRYGHICFTRVTGFKGNKLATTYTDGFINPGSVIVLDGFDFTFCMEDHLDRLDKEL